MKTDHQSDAQSTVSDWRNLPVHPAAEMLPMMSDEEIEGLASDIKQNGLLEPIMICDGQLLDGRGRGEAIRRLGPDYDIPDERVWTLPPCTDPYTYVLSKNVHRRHLTPEQKRDAIAKLIKAKPRTSNRKIAKALKVDDKTVAAVRAETVPNAEIPQMEHKPIERAKSAVRENPDASVTELAAAANVGRATIQRAQYLVKAEGPKPVETPVVNGLSRLERSVLADANAKPAKSRDASSRKDLTDEVADDVARTLNDLWQKWITDNPDVDWQMFCAAVRRFIGKKA